MVFDGIARCSLCSKTSKLLDQIDSEHLTNTVVLRVVHVYIQGSQTREYEERQGGKVNYLDLHGGTFSQTVRLIGL
eukprot:126539-Pelagomonas_calceolata.AAC.2